MNDLDDIENDGYVKLKQPVEANVSYFEKMQVYKDSEFAENLKSKTLTVTSKINTEKLEVTDLSSTNIEIEENLINRKGKSILNDISNTNTDISNFLNVKNKAFIKDLSSTNIEISNNLINRKGKSILNDISNTNTDISNFLNVKNKAFIKDLSCQIIDISNDKIKIQINNKIIDIDKKIIVDHMINFTEDVSMNKNDLFLRNIFINGNITHNSDEYFSFLRMINILFKKHLNLPDLYSNGSSEKEFNITDEYIKQKGEIKNNIYNFSDNTFLDNIPLEDWSGNYTYLSLQDLNDYYDISLNEENFNNYDISKNIQINKSKTVIKFTEALVKNNEHYYEEFTDVSFVEIKPDYGILTQDEINGLSTVEKEKLPKKIDISYVRIREKKPINPGVYFLYDNNNRDLSNNITSQSKNILKNVIKSNYKGTNFYSKKLQLEALELGIFKQELPLNLISSNHNIIFDYNYGYLKVYNEDRKFVDYNDLSENAINNFFTDLSGDIINDISTNLYQRFDNSKNQIDISINEIFNLIKENFKPEKEKENNINNTVLKKYINKPNLLKVDIFQNLLNYVRQYYYFNYFDKNHLINKRLFKIIDNNELILTFYKYIGRTKIVPNNYKIDGLLPINKSHFNDSSGLKINKTTLFGIDNSFNTLLYNNIAMGYKTVNNDYNSLVVGQFNDGENYRNNLFTVGCGTDVSENALNIDTSGNQEIRNKVYISLIESKDRKKINAYHEEPFNKKIDASGNNERNYNVAIDLSRVLIQSNVSMNTNLDVSQNVHFGHHDNRMTFDVSQGYVEFGIEDSLKNPKNKCFRFDIDKSFSQFGFDPSNNFKFDINNYQIYFGDETNNDNHVLFDVSNSFINIGKKDYGNRIKFNISEGNVQYGLDPSNNFKFDISNHQIYFGDETNNKHHILFDVSNNSVNIGKEDYENRIKFEIDKGITQFGKKEDKNKFEFDISNHQIYFGDKKTNENHVLFDVKNSFVRLGKYFEHETEEKENDKCMRFDIRNGNFKIGDPSNNFQYRPKFEFDIKQKKIYFYHDTNPKGIKFDFESDTTKVLFKKDVDTSMNGNVDIGQNVKIGYKDFTTNGATTNNHPVTFNVLDGITTFEKHNNSGSNNNKIEFKLKEERGTALFGNKIDVSMNSNLDVSKNVNFGLNQHPVNFDVFNGVTKFENKTDADDDDTKNKIIHFDVSKGHALFGHNMDVSMNGYLDVSKNVNFGLNQHPIEFNVEKGYIKFKNKHKYNRENQTIKFDVSDNKIFSGTRIDVSMNGNVDIGQNVKIGYINITTNGATTINHPVTFKVNEGITRFEKYNNSGSNNNKIEFNLKEQRGTALFGNKIDVSMNSNLDVSNNIHFGLKQHPVTFDTGAGVTKFQNLLSDQNDKIIEFNLNETKGRAIFGHKVDVSMNGNLDVSKNVKIGNDNYIEFDVLNEQHPLVTFNNIDVSMNNNLDVSHNVNIGKNANYNYSFDVDEGKIHFKKKGESTNQSSRQILIDLKSDQGHVLFGETLDISMNGNVDISQNVKIGKDLTIGYADDYKIIYNIKTEEDNVGGDNIIKNTKVTFQNNVDVSMNGFLDVSRNLNVGLNQRSVKFDVEKGTYTFNKSTENDYCFNIDISNTGNFDSDTLHPQNQRIITGHEMDVHIFGNVDISKNLIIGRHGDNKKIVFDISNNSVIFDKELDISMNGNVDIGIKRSEDKEKTINIYNKITNINSDIINLDATGSESGKINLCKNNEDDNIYNIELTNTTFKVKKGRIEIGEIRDKIYTLKKNSYDEYVDGFSFKIKTKDDKNISINKIYTTDNYRKINLYYIDDQDVEHWMRSNHGNGYYIKSNSNFNILQDYNSDNDISFNNISSKEYRIQVFEYIIDISSASVKNNTHIFKNVPQFQFDISFNEIIHLSALRFDSSFNGIEPTEIQFFYYDINDLQRPIIYQDISNTKGHFFDLSYIQIGTVADISGFDILGKAKFFQYEGQTGYENEVLKPPDGYLSEVHDICSNKFMIKITNYNGKLTADKIIKFQQDIKFYQYTGTDPSYNLVTNSDASFNIGFISPDINSQTDFSLNYIDVINNGIEKDVDFNFDRKVVFDIVFNDNSKNRIDQIVLVNKPEQNNTDLSNIRLKASYFKTIGTETFENFIINDISLNDYIYYDASSNTGNTTLTYDLSKNYPKKGYLNTATEYNIYGFEKKYYDLIFYPPTGIEKNIIDSNFNNTVIKFMGISGEDFINNTFIFDISNSETNSNSSIPADNKMYQTIYFKITLTTPDKITEIENRTPYDLGKLEICYYDSDIYGFKGSKYKLQSIESDFKFKRMERDNSKYKYIISNDTSNNISNTLRAITELPSYEDISSNKYRFELSNINSNQITLLENILKNENDASFNDFFEFHNNSIINDNSYSHVNKSEDNENPELLFSYDIIENNIVIDDTDTMINNNCIFNGNVEFNYPVKLQNGVQFSGINTKIETKKVEMNPSIIKINNVEDYSIPGGGLEFTKGGKSITGFKMDTGNDKAAFMGFDNYFGKFYLVKDSNDKINRAIDSIQGNQPSINSRFNQLECQDLVIDKLYCKDIIYNKGGDWNLQDSNNDNSLFDICNNELSVTMDISFNVKGNCNFCQDTVSSIYNVEIKNDETIMNKKVSMKNDLDVSENMTIGSGNKIIKFMTKNNNTNNHKATFGSGIKVEMNGELLDVCGNVNLVKYDNDYCFKAEQDGDITMNFKNMKLNSDTNRPLIELEKSLMTVNGDIKLGGTLYDISGKFVNTTLHKLDICNNFIELNANYDGRVDNFDSGILIRRGISGENPSPGESDISYNNQLNIVQYSFEFEASGGLVAADILDASMVSDIFDISCGKEHKTNYSKIFDVSFVNVLMDGNGGIIFDISFQAQHIGYDIPTQLNFITKIKIKSSSDLSGLKVYFYNDNTNKKYIFYNNLNYIIPPNTDNNYILNPTNVIHENYKGIKVKQTKEYAVFGWDAPDNRFILGTSTYDKLIGSSKNKITNLNSGQEILHLSNTEKTFDPANLLCNDLNTKNNIDCEKNLTVTGISEFNNDVSFNSGIVEINNTNGDNNEGNTEIIIGSGEQMIEFNRDNGTLLIKSGIDVSMNSNLDVSKNVHFGLNRHPVTFNTGEGVTKFENTLDGVDGKIIEFNLGGNKAHAKFGTKTDVSMNGYVDISENLKIGNGKKSVVFDSSNGIIRFSNYENRKRQNTHYTSDEISGQIENYEYYFNYIEFQLKPGTSNNRALFASGINVDISRNLTVGRQLKCNNALVLPVINMSENSVREIYIERPHLSDLDYNIDIPADDKREGISGEILYDSHRGKFLGYYPRKHNGKAIINGELGKYKDLNGGAISETGNVSIFCADSGENDAINGSGITTKTYDNSGLYFYIDKSEEKRDGSNALMKFIKGNDGISVLDVSENIHCNNIKVNLLGEFLNDISCNGKLAVGEELRIDKDLNVGETIYSKNLDISGVLETNEYIPVIIENYINITDIGCFQNITFNGTNNLNTQDYDKQLDEFWFNRTGDDPQKYLIEDLIHKRLMMTPFSASFDPQKKWDKENIKKFKTDIDNNENFAQFISFNFKDDSDYIISINQNHEYSNESNPNYFMLFWKKKEAPDSSWNFVHSLNHENLTINLDKKRVGYSFDLSGQHISKYNQYILIYYVDSINEKYEECITFEIKKKEYLIINNATIISNKLTIEDNLFIESYNSSLLVDISNNITKFNNIKIDCNEDIRIGKKLLVNKIKTAVQDNFINIKKNYGIINVSSINSENYFNYLRNMVETSDTIDLNGILSDFDMKHKKKDHGFYKLSEITDICSNTTDICNNIFHIIESENLDISKNINNDVSNNNIWLASIGNFNGTDNSYNGGLSLIQFSLSNLFENYKINIARDSHVFDFVILLKKETENNYKYIFKISNLLNSGPNKNNTYNYRPDGQHTSPIELETDETYIIIFFKHANENDNENTLDTAYFEITYDDILTIENNTRTTENAYFNKTVDISNRLIIPFLDMDKNEHKYETRPDISGVSGEILYDSGKNKFLGYYPNKKKYKEMGGGANSDNGLVSIICVEKDTVYEKGVGNFDTSGAHFYIGIKEDDRKQDNSIMKLQDISGRILLDLSGDISCNNLSIRENAYFNKTVDISNRLIIPYLDMKKGESDYGYKKRGDNIPGVSGEILYDSGKKKFLGYYPHKNKYKVMGGGANSETGLVSIMCVDKGSDNDVGATFDTSGTHFYIGIEEDDRTKDNSIMKLEYRDFSGTYFNEIFDDSTQTNTNGYTLDLSGSMRVYQHFTLQSGNMAIRVGDINVDSGDINVIGGDIKVDSGDINVIGGDINVTSDERLKTNIKKIQNSMEIITNIRGVEFNWNKKMKELHSSISTSKKELGVIAQEVEEFIPEMIKTNDNGYKMVNYNKLIPILLEGIKTQQKQIGELKQENKELKENMNKIYDRLSILEEDN